MKPSRYNLFFEKTNNVLCYNSFTDSFLVIPKKPYHCFIDEDLASFQEKYSKYCDAFEESGFIIEDSLDELGNLRLKNKRAIFNQESYSLIVYPTYDCNLKCWYCYETHVPNSIMAEGVQEKVISHIRFIVNEKRIRFLQVTFFGGEPLLNHDTVAFPLLEKIKAICDNAGVSFHCFFVTNATLLSEEIILRLKEFNPMFQITLDGNQEKHNKVRAFKSGIETSFDKIINALKLVSKHISLDNPKHASVATIRINYDNTTLKGIDGIIEEIKDLDKDKFIIHLERIWQMQDKINAEQEELLKSTILKLSLAGFRVDHGIFHRKSYVCHAECYNHAVINYNGLVYKCDGRSLVDMTAEGVLLESGEIEWDNSFLVRRSAVATFENEKCLECKMLPQCMGPCSQKQMEQGWGNIDKVCSLKAIDISLEDYLTLDFETKYIIEQNKLSKS
jgi:uncharacterized protein